MIKQYTNTDGREKVYVDLTQVSALKVQEVYKDTADETQEYWYTLVEWHTPNRPIYLDCKPATAAQAVEDWRMAITGVRPPTGIGEEMREAAQKNEL